MRKDGGDRRGPPALNGVAAASRAYLAEPAGIIKPPVPSVRPSVMESECWHLGWPCGVQFAFVLSTDLSRGIICTAPFALETETRSVFAMDTATHNPGDACTHDMRATPRFFGTIMAWLYPCGVVYLLQAQRGAGGVVESARLLTDRASPGTISTLVYDMACALSSSLHLRNPHMASNT